VLQFASGFFGLALVALWAWAILDVLLTDKSVFRRMNKPFWFVLVLFTSTLGAIGWLAFGRPKNAGFSPGAKLTKATFTNRPPGPRGPEDYANWDASTEPSLPTDQLVLDAEEDFSDWEAEFDKRDSDLDDDD